LNYGLRRPPALSDDLSSIFIVIALYAANIAYFQ